MRGHGKIVAAHLVGNALLLWLAYYWLGVGEGGGWALVWSALVAAAIVCFTICLHGAAFAHFAGGTAAWRTALRRVAPLLAAAAAVGAIYWLLSLWAGYSGRPAFRIASYLTMKLRQPVRPASVVRIFNVGLWLVRWMVVPVLALPVVAAIASRGWKGFGSRGLRGRSLLYWVVVPLLLVCAFWLPFRVWEWVPRVNGFTLEMASFVLRALAGYLCFVGAWLVLVSLTSSGTPRPTQLNTAVSP